MSSLILSRTPSLSLHRTLFSLTLSRNRSNKSDANKFANIIEVDVAGGVRKLEDVIHNIIVRRSAPDWLPFLPGASYWVPPKRRSGTAGLVDIIGSITGSNTGRKSEEEKMALSYVRGWPSEDFYIQGSAPSRPVPVDVQVVEVKFQEDSENESQSEDDSDH